MHAPYAAQYCVIGGSGAGSGGSFTLEAAAICAALAAADSDAPLSALVADAGLAAIAIAGALAAGGPAVAVAGGEEWVVLVALVALVAEAPAAVVAVAFAFADAVGALAPVAASGMPVPGGVAEKLLGGNGGRDGTPVDEVFVMAG